MTLERRLPAEGITPPMIQQTHIWVDPDARPHFYGDAKSVTITFGGTQICWRIDIDPANYAALKEAIARSEDARKDLPPVVGAWQKFRAGRRRRWYYLWIR